MFFESGKIIFDTISFLSDQTIDLQEDILQVEYDDGRYVLDLGWYPEYDINGTFRLVVIYNHDWEDPIFAKQFKKISDLQKSIEEAIVFLKNHVNKK